MVSAKLISFGILMAVLAYIYRRKCNNSLLLAIGILSSRENFELRQAARSTWLKEYLSTKSITVKPWFIIGKNECNIPPSYRLSKYGCEKWNINSSGLQSMFYTAQEVGPASCISGHGKSFSQGFSFKVNHPVILRRLGVLTKLLVPNKETKIALLDIQSRKVLIQTVITSNAAHIKYGYQYEDVETILLPKDFEGMILVEGYLLSKVCSNVLFSNGSGVITFNRLYISPYHLESHQFNSEFYSAASVQFLIDDIETLKSIISNEVPLTTQWIKNNNYITEQLIEESKKYGDIVFVDVMDTYRNLPSKLLHFFKWLTDYQDFLYALKADDDTVVDISALMRNLEKHLHFQNEHWMWSRFRKDWPVNYIGKWADYDYGSSTYPTFPCGAAYVISRKSFNWLSSNIKDLFSYQGEDVSVGIWLSAVKPIFTNDDNFECDSKCKNSSYNRAQLTTKQIYEVWSTYERCYSLCNCD